MNIVIFSGGRGNKNLLKSLQEPFPNFLKKVQVVVNGLDDGASTGAIREMFGDSTHGISDFLKVAVAMSPNEELVNILNERFPTLTSSDEQLVFSNDLYKFLFLDVDLPFMGKYKGVDLLKSTIKKKILFFVDYFYKKDKFMPNLSDFKLGNIVFASMLAENKLDFQKSLVSFMNFCEVDKNKFEIIQSTETNSYLVGILKNGSLLPNEAAVVLTRTNDFISRIYQLPKPLTAADIRNICSIELEDKIHFLDKCEEIPEAGEEALKAIKNSSALIYGAGTPYSSLLPSLELKGVADAIKNTKCPKILVANLVKETSNTISASDLIKSVLKFLEKSIDDKKDFNPSDFITHVVIPDDESNLEVSKNFISMNIDEIQSNFKWLNIVSADIRSPHNLEAHDGNKLKECLFNIVNAN
tara:strand:+ start:7934 stop:9172 length:1239 start_codon:yes stop_codon:yes gene_type:complete